MSVHIVQSPRAIAVVLPHLGATSTQVETYIEWYRSRNCSVVAAVSPPRRFICNASLQDTGHHIIADLRRAIRDADTNRQSGEDATSRHRRTPVVMHTMSNGGAFLLEQVELLLQKESQSTGAGDVSATEEDAGRLNVSNDDILDRIRLGYQLFDSCPCYIRMIWNTKDWTQSFPHPNWSLRAFQPLYTVAASLSLTAWCTVTFAWHRPSQFWKRMEVSTVCPHAIYVYSSCDLLSDAFWTRQLLQKRREEFPQIQIAEHRFEDSDHCRMHRDHPDEYFGIIDGALAAATQRANDASKGADVGASARTSTE